jgi:hypothetical protein
MLPFLAATVTIACRPCDVPHILHGGAGPADRRENCRAQRDSDKLNLALPNNSQIGLASFPSALGRPSYPDACGLRHQCKILEWLASRGTIPAARLRPILFAGRPGPYESKP